MKGYARTRSRSARHRNLTRTPRNATYIEAPMQETPAVEEPGAEDGQLDFSDEDQLAIGIGTGAI